MKNLIKEAEKIRFKIDERLNGYNGANMPPEKTARANELVKHIKGSDLERYRSSK
ncbi:hypothetical protein [Parachryseolinea silvisoli]|uniref:hypothetical protein n=1 Tax=Parachryseolinea silvisoli TaxID=2873601 RepID=UPI0022659B27|nr:hypothetical protein [Parachryseolinea silvisoli]MCD9017503.1 hypothetical protein [Parachryseolinea silvisoli]